jgi:hypothetical protein
LKWGALLRQVRELDNVREEHGGHLRTINRKAQT